MISQLVKELTVSPGKYNAAMLKLQCLSHLDILLIRSLRFNVKQLRYVAIRVQTWNPNISLFIQFTFNFIFYGDFILLCNRENLLYESLELF